ncbi:MAG: GNAT family N-acetyltransferase [Candidatus Abyssobacteria bacterium SURF_17]|uniref:GNAT family N-acetyltransferase n=1 Tax=Candidatus Abyssobacteria bacterium SURF_17 TaxID=2093361 RepID=A0A419F0G2_9BACT|nr:MAG: GNAT family N-acetyltransferase [Candidatus Abyssubacteria bacterium SURF_17]
MKSLGKPSVELWEKVVQECEYATFFHTPTWARIIENSMPAYQVGTRAYELEDGTCAILPLMASGQAHRKRYHSMVPGVYGGPIAKRKLTSAEVVEIFSGLHRFNVRRIDVTGNPLFIYDLPANYECREDFTHILRLDATFDSVWRGFTKGHKSSARKAERMGVHISLAQSLDDFKEYYRVYEDSLRRWADRATSRYEFDLFQNIFNENCSDIKLWLASVTGKVIAGALVLYVKEHIAWWHGASLEEYFEYCAPNLLNVEIMKDGCKRGYLYYDFNPSGGHKGVARFKQSFGAEKRRIPRWRWKFDIVDIVKSIPKGWA